MSQITMLNSVTTIPRGTEFQQRIENTIRINQQDSKPFFLLLLQLDNFENFAKKRPRYVVLNFYKEMFEILRKSIQSHHFIGNFQNGYGMVFNGVDPGNVDTIAKRLANMAYKIIQEGRYNDLTSRWTDIIQQFLVPQKPISLFPRVGWSIYPRDGQTASQLVQRALYHLKELNR